jgi:hypothetical protein
MLRPLPGQPAGDHPFPVKIFYRSGEFWPPEMKVILQKSGYPPDRSSLIFHHQKQQPKTKNSPGISSISCHIVCRYFYRKHQNVGLGDRAHPSNSGHLRSKSHGFTHRIFIIPVTSILPFQRLIFACQPLHFYMTAG